MKTRLEIDPEIRGLLEEIAADPRSALRLAPRRALREWFDRGEAARTRDVASTPAERHLIEAYREEVAELLLGAAEMAFWSDAVYFHPPLDASGIPRDPRSNKPALRRRVERLPTSLDVDGVSLLRECIGGAPTSSAFSLARASVALAPGHYARAYMASFVPWNQPRLSLRLLERLLPWTPLERRPALFRQRASRLCELGLLEQARETYRCSAQLVQDSTLERCYTLNLSCFLGDPAMARLEALELGRLAHRGDPRISRARDILTSWTATQGAVQRSDARRVALEISDSVPDVVRPLMEVIQA